MDKLTSNIEMLESSIKDLRSLIADQNRFASKSNFLLGCGTAITAASIYTLPKWTSVIFAAFMSVYAIVDKRRINSQIANKLNEIHSIASDINDSISNLLQQIKQKERDNKDEEINNLTARIKDLELQLESEPASQPIPVQRSNEKSLAEFHLDIILKKIQGLDIEVEDFGEECTSYIRKEFKKTLRQCGYEFIEYSYENQQFFDTERGAIDHVDCTARAIVTIASPKLTILRGHAFIPEV